MNGRKTSRPGCYVLTTLQKVPSQQSGPSYTCIQGGPDPSSTLTFAFPNPQPHPVPLPSNSSMKLKTVASLSAAIVNGTHRPEHRVGKRTIAAGLAFSATPQLKAAVSLLCGVRRRNPGNHTNLPLTLNQNLGVTQAFASAFHCSQVVLHYFSAPPIWRTASRRK